MISRENGLRVFDTNLAGERTATQSVPLQKERNRDYIIKTVRDESSRKEIYRFRYSVYIEEMNRNCKADHENKVIIDSLDDTGVLLGAYRQNLLTSPATPQLVGTCRANFSYNCDFEHRELYAFDQLERDYPKSVMFATKMMVRQEYRGTPLFLDLAKQIYVTSLLHGAIVMVIDCNDHLVKPFMAMGFQAYRSRFMHPDYGWVNPLAMNNYDFDHLQSIRSPFLSLLKQHIAMTSLKAREEQEKTSELSEHYP